MGSPLRLAVVGSTAAQAESAWSAISDRIEAVEESLSRFRETSAVTLLNRRAGNPAAAPVDRDLYRALAASDRAWRLTGGAFDARVLTDLERLGYAGAAFDVDPAPGSAAPEAAPEGAPPRLPTFADGTWLRRDPFTRAVAISAPVDLGGIGKGLALRWAFAAAARHLPGFGTTSGALLEAGGDLVAAGPAPQPGPWMVGIEHPLAEGEELAIIAVYEGAVSTSSVAVNAWRTADGRPVHHLLDPSTGEPGGSGLLAVTVAGSDPAWTEVWSKTLFLEGAGGIGPRARARGLAAWWVDLDGHLEMTPAARVITAWEA